ncbi:MAG: lipoyl synthase [Paludibacter sp.]|jgi:lipoic acid synthetase|nr:lipoyl synthase [Paludibacter sp.]
MNYIRKPEWLKSKIYSEKQFTTVSDAVKSRGLHTICTSGRCPNMSECWSRGTATLMICGDICTRACKFCNTLTGKPLSLDANEPEKVALSIQSLKLRHAVITSVDRDDLPDKAAAHWAATIRAIKTINPATTLEVLIPDFDAKPELLDLVIGEKPNIISHNLETVKRLTPLIRSRASYEKSLQVLQYIVSQGITAKTGIMLGLGETEPEILQLMDDALAAGCSIITIGQYLQPSRQNIPVSQYVHPDKFAEYKTIALDKGFQKAESGVFVRSSYHAENHV